MEFLGKINNDIEAFVDNALHIIVLKKGKLVETFYYSVQGHLIDWTGSRKPTRTYPYGCFFGNDRLNFFDSFINHIKNKIHDTKNNNIS